MIAWFLHEDISWFYVSTTIHPYLELFAENVREVTSIFVSDDS